jgi:thioredoxin-dependent adenylylsulfate APS reductase
MTDISQLELLPAPDLLRWVIGTYGESFAICTSFQKTGMVILDMAARISTEVRVVTLDTGRLPEETHQMIDTVREKYGVRVETASPDPAELEAMVRSYGVNLFRQEPALRQLCCEIRKVRPLERKLAGFRAWATGLRRSQSVTRASVTKAEEENGRLKLNPLADWTGGEVEDYIRRHDVPVHPLYAQGYASIGCAPCTRPVAPGEDERAGRWWWEQDEHKECGIHFGNGGAVLRGPVVLVNDILQGTNA